MEVFLAIGSAVVCSTILVFLLNRLPLLRKALLREGDHSEDQDHSGDVVQSLSSFCSLISPESTLPEFEIALIGAGPGDVKLMTVSALQHLMAAQLVVADRLIPENVLKLARSAGAEVWVAQKSYGRAHQAQEEIYAACIQGLQVNKRVVRLKGGDPFVFGRGGEEVLRFRERGYNCVIVPGLSSSLAAPALGGIPLTVRGVADSFVVATAHGKNDTEARLPSYVPARTVVLLMGVSTLPLLSSKLVSARGFPRELPAAIVEKAGRPEQRTLVSTLGELAHVAEAQGVRAPAVIVLGHVVMHLAANS